MTGSADSTPRAPPASPRNETIGGDGRRERANEKRLRVKTLSLYAAVKLPPPSNKQYGRIAIARIRQNNIVVAAPAPDATLSGQLAARLGPSHPKSPPAACRPQQRASRKMDRCRRFCPTCQDRCSRVAGPARRGLRRSPQGAQSQHGSGLLYSRPQISDSQLLVHSFPERNMLKKCML